MKQEQQWKTTQLHSPTTSLFLALCLPLPLLRDCDDNPHLYKMYFHLMDNYYIGFEYILLLLFSKIGIIH